MLVFNALSYLVLCMYAFCCKCPSVWTKRKKTILCQSLELFDVCNHSFLVCFFIEANLCLFGSSCNGFGFADSDLDITLTFEGCPSSDVSRFKIFHFLSVLLFSAFSFLLSNELDSAFKVSLYFHSNLVEHWGFTKVSLFSGPCIKDSQLLLEVLYRVFALVFFGRRLLKLNQFEFS